MQRSNESTSWADVSPWRFALALIIHRPLLLLASSVSAAVWFVSCALTPFLTGTLVDVGIAAPLTRDSIPPEMIWAGAALAIDLVAIAVSGLLRQTLMARHRLSVFYLASFLTLDRMLFEASGRSDVAARGEKLTVVSTDAERLGQLSELFSRAIGALLGSLLVVILLLAISPGAGLMILVAVPVLIVLGDPVLHPLERAQARDRAQASRLSNSGLDLARGLVLIRGFRGETGFDRKYRSEANRLHVTGLRSGRWQAIGNTVSSLSAGLFVVAVVTVSGYHLATGAIQVGQYITILGYATFLVWPIRSLIELRQRLRIAKVSAERMLVFIANNTSGGEAVTFERSGYRDQVRDAKSGVIVDRGKIACVAPLSKNWPTDLISRFGLYSAGLQLASDARDSQNFDSVKSWVDRRRSSLIVDHDQVLFRGTLRDCVDPLRCASGAQVDEALRLACATDIVESAPGGLRHQVGELGYGLSGGQKERLILARAILVDPEILILVDPASSVDSITAGQIMLNLAAYRSNSFTLVVSRSASMLSRFEEVFVVASDKVVASGPHASLVASGYLEVAQSE